MSNEGEEFFYKSTTPIKVDCDQLRAAMPGLRVIMQERLIYKVKNIFTDYSAIEIACLRCGKGIELHHNGGEMDERLCCGLHYRTEPYRTDLNVYERIDPSETIKLHVGGDDRYLKVGMTMTTDIDSTLNERGKRYGEYSGHAKITQGLKQVMHQSPNWNALKDDQKETLEMVAHKIGRILNGDPEYHDSWHDLVGYCKLSADEILAREKVRRALLSVTDDSLPEPSV